MHHSAFRALPNSSPDRGDHVTEQLGSERFVLCAFRMPLHTHVERAAGISYGFDDAVVCGCENSHRTRIVDGLSVVAVDGASPDGRVAGRDDLVIVIPVICVRIVRLGKVLVEMTARDKRHHLHTEAHTQDRCIRSLLKKMLDERGFVFLSHRIDMLGFGMRRLSEGLGSRVIASDKDNRVAESGVLCQSVDRGRQHDGDSPRFDNALGVVRGDDVAWAFVECLHIGEYAHDRPGF